MTKLSPEICAKIKEARRQAKLSQSTLAAEVGCKQSALSMFEQGDGTKLNDAVINKLAEKFGISLVEAPATEVQKIEVTSASPVIGFCPNPHCPSNHAYEVDGRTLMRPNREEADPVGAKFCALCGEVLEKKCPNCGSAIHDGAICSYCGDPYIAIA